MHIYCYTIISFTVAMSIDDLQLMFVQYSGSFYDTFNSVF